GVHLVGDVMYEVTKTAAGAAARRRAELLDRLGLAERQYYLATVHRAENTDQPRRLEAIFSALSRCERCVVVPLHPRTRQRLGNGQLAATGRLKLIEPLGYPDMVALIGSARIVLTDSGGLQKESYWLGVPCITLRERTEWPELVEAGCNRLTGADPTAIASALAHFESQEARLPADLPPELYGDGQAARRIVEVLANSGS
ncbi:MAG: UDP-N-acetylglucosamine 2-epimerase, partial [Phycisphaerae bacterium]